jgi:hypothetical protein
MPRPLMQHGVGQLEDMFGSCRGNLQVLRQLENELQHRQVPRALALLVKVQAAMAASGDGPREPPSRAPTAPPPPAPAPPKQPDLWGQTPAPVVPPARLPPSPPVAVGPTLQPPRPAPSVRPADAPAAPKPAAPTAPTMPLEDAYKLLKATAGSTWESIEQTRRQLVQQAHPSRVESLSPERRAQALSEARRVNVAYAVLSTQRAVGG